LEWLKNMQSTISNSSTETVRTLQENTKQLNERLDTAARVIRDVEKEVGQMSEIGRNMRELQDFLKSPKLRGNIGEQVLKDLIAQMFPKNSFHLQYEFKSGEKVDAAIQTDAGILPIDSKFPMENYQKMVKATDLKEKEMFEKEFVRDVKKHIDAISKKYILPAEGTMDFALMYIPSESVYYEVVNQIDTLDYARRLRVYMVSPSTFMRIYKPFFYLLREKELKANPRNYLRSFEACKLITKKSKKICQRLANILTMLIHNSVMFYRDFQALGQKLNTTKSLQDKEKELEE
jgi:DNA recombination protein RmuC